MYSKFQKKIMEELINKYYQSNHFKNENGKKVFVTDDFINNAAGGQKSPTASKKYGGKNAEYNSIEFRKQVNEELYVLEKKNYISLVEEEWPVPLYRKVILNLEKVTKIIEEFSLFNEEFFRKKLITILNKYKDKEPLENYIKEQIDKYNNYQKVDFSYEIKNGSKIETLDKMEIIYKLAIAVYAQKDKEEIYCRNLSVKAIGNSKTLEKLLKQVYEILYFIEKIDYDDIHDYFARFNVVFNPEDIRIKGECEIEFKNGSRILLNGNCIGIMGNEIKEIEKIKIRNDKIYTIENLTTFNDSILDGFMIYTNGFPSQSRCKLLKKILQENQEKKYFHYGDIDSGGFYIFNRIKEIFNNLIPYRMDVQALLSKKDKWISLTETDKKRLLSILDNQNLTEFYEVIQFMFENNCKLEQENFYDM